MSERIDLRSDTLTVPTRDMRRAIAEAEVGDDVYAEDPTVRRLEERAAELVGREASLLVPSGTMANQIAIHIHAPRGSDVLVEHQSHVYLYELGGMAAWTGALPRVLAGRHGRLTPDQIDAAIAPDEYDLARASLLVLENSHNHAGGIVLDRDQTEALARRAHRHGLRVHLDGARIFNAALAVGQTVPRLTAAVDSLMFCLSKGLGAPVGSMLCGSRSFIDEARIVRKRMGGGMRQAGILAAAGLHALEHHVQRLADDHRRAGRLAQALAAHPRLRLDPDEVRTNIVIVAVDPGDDAEPLLRRLAEHGLLASAMGPGRIRFVTHLGIDDAAIERAIAIVRRC